MVIKTLPFQSLLKLELPQLAEKVIEQVETHDPELLKIEELYNLLIAQKPQILNLKVVYGAHPITEQLTPLRKKRFMYAAAIVYKMNVIVREDIYPNNSDVIATKILINSFLLNLSGNKNEEIVAEKLTQFFRTMSENPTFLASLELFKLTTDISSLRMADQALRELLKQRADSISERPRVKTTVNVQSIQKALKDMFKEIESAQLRNPLLNYSSLINKLNDLLDHYRMLINIRATINKRKAQQLKNGKGEAATDIVNPTLPAEETDPSVEA